VGAAAGAYGGSETGVGSMTGAIMGAAMTSPAGMSREAILLKDPKVQEMLRQLPRATAMALVELLRERSAGPAGTPAPQE
jgi:hypothetical protein